MTWKFATLLALLATFGLLVTTNLIGATRSSHTANTDDTKTASKTVKIGGIDWHVDYDKAMKVAKEKKLPLWLHFGENPG